MEKVQCNQLFHLNGGGMRLTISKYYLPSGDSISEVGIKPDIFVEKSV